MLASFAAILAVQAQKSGGLPQLNVPDFAPQLIWLALTFGLLYFLLSKVALPRIAEVLEERQDRIHRDVQEAERLKSETEKALAAYEQSLAEARGRATSIARETREKLAAETDKEKTRVEAELSTKLNAAELQIAATKKQALSNVDDIAADTAAEIVARLLGQPVGVDEARRALTQAKGG
jgi:F-type H+-transporting ATPase subunit b